MSRTGRVAGLLAAAAALTACGGGAAQETAPPSVTVRAGEQEVSVDPTQYCLAGEGQRYTPTRPVLEVPAGTPIVLRVPDVVAEAGWDVQVFDERLQERIGEVAVEPGTTEFDGINSSDVTPPAFHLVVVEHGVAGDCAGLAGAWPIGFIRAEGGDGTAPPSPAG